jgi:hypothetical protein
MSPENVMVKMPAGFYIITQFTLFWQYHPTENLTAELLRRQCPLQGGGLWPVTKSGLRNNME